MNFGIAAISKRETPKNKHQKPNHNSKTNHYEDEHQITNHKQITMTKIFKSKTREQAYTETFEI